VSEELKRLIERAVQVLNSVPDVGKELIWAYEYARKRGWIRRRRGE